MKFNIKKRIIEVLELGHLMSLGTMDGNGIWVADVIYIFDKDLNLYWMSSDKTRHSKALSINKKVAGSITISNKSKEVNLGIQFEGIAKQLKKLSFSIAKQHLIKRGYSTSDKSALILKKGTRWYTMKLTSVDLIDEKNFGFDKQIFKIPS